MRIPPRTGQPPGRSDEPTKLQAPAGLLTSLASQAPANSTPLARLAPGSFPGTVPVLESLTQWRALAEEFPREQFRWPLEAMPLAVSIEPNPELPDFDRLLMSVIRQWEVASQGLIRFKQAGPLDAERDGAQIHVQWADETVLGRDYEVGHAKRTVNGQRITHVAVTLIRHPLIDAHLSPEHQRRRLQATILHEFGHALGLEHSDMDTDVMHHRGWQRPSLSEKDAQRLFTLYKSANGRIT